MKFQRAKSVIHQFETISNQIAEAKTKRSNFETRLMEDLNLPASFQEKIEDTDDEIAAAERRIVELQNEIVELNIRRGQFKHGREQAQAHAEEAKSIIGQIDKDIARLVKKLAPFEKELTAAHEKVQEIQAKQIAENILAKTIEEKIRPEFEKEIEVGKRVPSNMKPEVFSKNLARKINRGRK